MQLTILHNAMQIQNQTRTLIASTMRWWRRLRKPSPIRQGEELAEFIGENCAFVSQSALYGYIKTRAGLRYFRMFDDSHFTDSVNIAKWNIYAVSVGDLAMFCGAHLYRNMSGQPDNNTAAKLTALMSAAINRALPSRPPDAGDDYERLVEESRQRILHTDWLTLRDDESAFALSPAALVFWSPIADEHKKHDENIVMNSMLFKWKEVRDQFRQRANMDSLTRAVNKS